MAKPNGVIYSSPNSPHHPKLYNVNSGFNHYKQGSGHLKFSSKRFWLLGGKSTTFIKSRRSSLVCQSTETRDTDTKECVRRNVSSGDERSIETEKIISSSEGLAEACKFVYNDAKFVNERARNDIVLLSRGIMRWDARARQDVAFLGSEFLKLDARARKDTEKIERKAERLHHIATILKKIAESRLKSAADKHWSDGALEADLKRADFAAKRRAMEDSLMALEVLFLLTLLFHHVKADLKRADFAAKRRAMEDSLMALEFVKNIHDMMVGRMNGSKRDSIYANEVTSHITLEKNGKALDFIPGEVSEDRISAIQEAYWSIASALSEADGIDYTDPEELELLVATLIDLDAMDGKSSVSLLAECSSSPDDSTRKALANALSAAPSMWTLGNAGMGALQRLANDKNPAIAKAASKTIYELKKQWEIEEGDSWRFMMNQSFTVEADDDEEEDDTGAN